MERLSVDSLRSPEGNADTSVVIPTRGHGAWIPLTLDSALANAGVLEVIFAHDRRPGEPALGPALRTDPRTRVVESPTPGLPSARNAGLAAARGRLVSFLDDDDLWLPQHLTYMREVLGRHPGASLVACDIRYFDDPSPDAASRPPVDLESLPRFRPQRTEGPISLHDLLLANQVSASAVTLVRDRLAPEDRFDPALLSIEDYELWLRMADRHLLVFDPRPGAIVRRRRGSMSRNLKRMAETTLAVLRPHLAHGLAKGEISRREARARLGRLQHELAYAHLLCDDARAARAALRQSIARAPWLIKNWAYAAASWLPGPARRAVFAHGRKKIGPASPA